MSNRRPRAAGPTAKRRRPDVSPTDATPRFSLTNDVFTVGWICALDVELAPSIAMLDEEFPNLPQILGDSNTYTPGRIGEHKVVLACLPAGTTGANAAATAATNMMRSFPNIRFGLMVGVGGGAPDRPSNDPRQDIRLGDIVVSCPTGDSSGVLQYDFGKTIVKGQFVQTGTLNKTSMTLRTGISKLRAHHRMQESRVPLYIATMLESRDKMREDFDHPGPEQDQLFRSDYDHEEGQLDCDGCNKDAILPRNPRANKDPIIHYGLIGSANQVMRDGITRDKLRQEKGILCFEMEAAGLMDSIPCLSIRGICDYADTHKNKRWQPYAAAAAAAYAKEILSVIPAAEVASASTTNATNMHDILRSAISELNLDQLLQLLPVLEKNQPSPEALNLDPNEPQFSWVFRNIDYKSWKSNDSPTALCLSKLGVHHLSQISAYIVGQEEKLNRPVLFCSCSQIAGHKFVKNFVRDEKNYSIRDKDKKYSVRDEDIPIINVLICTLLDQVVRLSPIEERMLMMQNFLIGLLQKSFEKKTTQNWIGHGFNEKNLIESVQSFLGNAAKEDILPIFRMTLDHTKQQYPMVVIDGIENDSQCEQLLRPIGKFVIDYQRQNPYVKVLLAGPAACDTPGLPQKSLFIAYDKERKECLSSLHFENTRYEKISPEHSGSFEWIWTHNEYKSWSISETSQLLYIQGKPGSGKSTLTKYFDSNLQTRQSHAKQAIVAKFFYSYREGETQRSHYNMLLTLLYDILRQEEAFFYHQCQFEYRTHRHDGLRVKWDYASLKRVLKSLQNYLTKNRFYLIIDAVDESEDTDRRDILGLLCNLCSGMQYCVVKIFIASRPVTQLEALRGEFLNFIRLQDQTVLDISDYANSLLDGLDLTREITYMIKHAQGVFLWVKLVGEELLRLHEDGYSEYDIYLMLKQLPTELEELYELMLDKMRANKSCLTYGLKMFQFVLFAQRPLRVNELLHSLGIPDDNESDPTFSLSDQILEKRVPSSERIIISCGGNFLEIKQQDEGQRVVQLIHQTALEFLRNPHGMVSKSEFCIDEDHAHMCIATTCIRYSMICAANTSLRAGLPNSEPWISEHYEYYAKYLDKRPLTLYASHHLKHHVNSCREYVKRNPNTQYFPTQLTDAWISDPFSYLLESWVGSHLDQNALQTLRNELFIAAAQVGSDVVAELLLSVGADVNIKDLSGRSPLSWAAGNGQEYTIRLLLQQNSHVNHQDQSGRTPLSWAVGNGQESAARLLFGHYADIDLPDQDKRTPLIWAVNNRQESAARLLLEYNADVNSRDYCEQTPLSYAVENGQESTAKLLLEYNADVNSRNNAKRTPLSCAVEYGQESTARLLLQYNADVDAQDNLKRTPLAWAAMNGRASAMRLLLQYNAYINSRDDVGWTPLIWAAGNGNEPALRLLLEHNADVNIPDSDGLTPLSWAAKNGQESVVKLLLEKYADIDLPDYHGLTPLSWAARNGHQPIVELLLLRGADVNAAHRWACQTSLWWATKNENAAIIELLQNNGATF